MAIENWGGFAFTNTYFTCFFCFFLFNFKDIVMKPISLIFLSNFEHVDCKKWQNRFVNKQFWLFASLRVWPIFLKYFFLKFFFQPISQNYCSTLYLKCTLMAGLHGKAERLLCSPRSYLVINESIVFPTILWEKSWKRVILQRSLSTLDQQSVFILIVNDKFKENGRTEYIYKYINIHMRIRLYVQYQIYYLCLQIYSN